ncbi:MAG TPA: hypothetical protein VHP11_17715 [Tepidisphaeraceae bacterium]|nr:hypothetical protein [Tepidisphaeraceae bacterium]
MNYRGALVAIALLLSIGGCVTSRVVRNENFPGPASQYTLAGTPKQEVLSHLGPPSSVTIRGATETLHYQITGTEEVKYLFGLPHDQQRPYRADVELVLLNGKVAEGHWKDVEGHAKRW